MNRSQPQPSGGDSPLQEMESLSALLEIDEVEVWVTEKDGIKNDERVSNGNHYQH